MIALKTHLDWIAFSAWLERFHLIRDNVLSDAVLAAERLIPWISISSGEEENLSQKRKKMHSNSDFIGPKLS